jgi:signal transduction histidine kinase
MKERATAMGGVFRIDNAKSGGIQVTARLPLCPTERNGKATVRPRRAAASKPTGTARIRRK